MSDKVTTSERIARHWGWLVVCPVLSVCGGGSPLGTANPGMISDLAVAATTEVSVTLSFTQVDDGMGHPAQYDVRYAAGPISWGSALSAASGTCSTPVAGTGLGSALTCTVLALSPGTSYSFQVMPFRGTLDANAVFGGPSNVVSATTAASPPPALQVTTVTVLPVSASVQAGSTSVLQATVKDQFGNPMSGAAVAWRSNNTTVATVNASGVVTGLAAGSASITATSSGISGTSAITVTAPPPASVVTTVSVAPASASIATGAMVSLQATVKDQNGSPMSGQPVTWSTSDASVATVNGSGVVSGVGLGAATITAASSGKTGTSSITVTAPPPPPTGVILFQENFEDAALASREWYDNTNAQLSSVEHVAGSNSSAQYHFLSGATTPTSGGSQRHKFAPSNSFYLSFYVKYSPNWVGSGAAYHPHEFYVLSNLDGDFDGPSQNYLDVYIEHNYQNGGKPRLAFQDNKSVNYNFGALPNNLIATTEDRSTGGCNGVVESNIFSECFNFGTYWYNDKQLTGPVVFQPTPGLGYKNNWNFVEAYFQLNTVANGIGQPNGVAQYWFNGTLIIDRHDILYRTGAHPTLQFNQFIIAPYIGDGSPVDQSMFIDNLRAATARIP